MENTDFSFGFDPDTYTTFRKKRFYWQAYKTVSDLGDLTWKKFNCSFEIFYSLEAILP